MTVKHNTSKLVGFGKSSSKREVYSNTILPQEIKKNLYLKQLEKEEKK